MKIDACVVCGCEAGEALTSATGLRYYCGACFHGWRVDKPVFSYSNTAMCSLGTSQERVNSQIGFFAPFAPKGAAILEIGCATGELAQATRAALNVARYDAVELSPAGDQARAHLNRLFTKPLRELLDAGEITPGYDLVLISHVLEHVVDPVAEIAAVKRLLKPGGALFAEVPNGAGSRALPIDDNVSHLHFFSPTSLMRMLAGQGLAAVATATDAFLDIRYSDSLRVVAKPFERPAWNAKLLSDHPTLGADPVVVWGAGSLVEEILANFFDPAKIDFFVDHDPTKQGHERLGRPVCAPEALGAQPRTVLVNSIDFADAIAADVGRRYPGVAHRLVPIGELLS